MTRIGVSLSVGYNDLEPQALKIFDVVQLMGGIPLVVLCTHSVLDPEGTNKVMELCHKYPDKIFPAIADSGSFSAAYLLGMQVAVEKGADFVISMDSDGAHDVCEIPKFIHEFTRGHEVVLASRVLPGGANKYPLQRRVVSRVATILANILLVPWSKRITDFSSGYEGLSRYVVQKLFKSYTPDTWISVVYGPYHLQNTELRLALLNSGYTIKEVPITYGVNKNGKPLKVGYLVQALLGFFRMVRWVLDQKSNKKG
ncbi:hypothetical protein A2415_00690 [candidate division WWE3 bacterium RIFOXYC1_FULL_39_7]|uniref:Glycosyltransferase 2-like domain-containing protein n=2 Tax=Katanobacteria TaxID=422282 RepID=A0A1F4X6Q3_UNCKA|nr:MAG: hypothetical protein A2415_00690 [candidate division WWE3 bacterium RIFOXYC1_FULL_39_7]OGC77338.1 MAG: hypothetical protein A2619_04865 [candidate division WWE3 bacterium RIFOXYD1_FULL_39_9]